MDTFGSTDPKQMPMHLFFGASAVHHHTAIRANIEKQNYSVCPRHWYIDADFKCERCGREFTGVSESRRCGLRITFSGSIRNLGVA